jgi:hypothetical protein
MPVLDANEIMFTQYEPKVPNRFIMYIDGIPSYIVKGVTAVTFDDGEIILDHINTYRKIRSGKRLWGDMTFTLFDPIAPSGAQAVMEWARLAYESVTGRAGYSDFYKKDLTFNGLGPVGDVVSEWIVKGAFIKTANFDDYDWSTYTEAINLTMSVGMDYCILNY